MLYRGMLHNKVAKYKEIFYLPFIDGCPIHLDTIENTTHEERLELCLLFAKDGTAE